LPYPDGFFPKKTTFRDSCVLQPPYEGHLILYPEGSSALCSFSRLLIESVFATTFSQIRYRKIQTEKGSRGAISNCKEFYFSLARRNIGCPLYPSDEIALLAEP
jgi:hypothetical protein